MIFGIVSWQQTWSNHDNLRHLTAEPPEVWLGYRNSAKTSRSFYALELVHFFERLYVHLYVGRWPWLDDVDENVALVGADLYAVASRAVFFIVSWLDRRTVGNALLLKPAK